MKIYFAIVFVFLSCDLFSQINLPAFQGTFKPASSPLSQSSDIVAYSSTGHEGKTYKTTDGGVTWTAVNNNVYHDIFFIKQKTIQNFL